MKREAKREAVDGEPIEPCARCGKMPRRVRKEHGVRYWDCWCELGPYMFDCLAWDAEQRRIQVERKQLEEAIR